MRPTAAENTKLQPAEHTPKSSAGLQEKYFEKSACFDVPRAGDVPDGLLD